MTRDQLQPGVILRGSLFPEPVQVITTIPMGNSTKLIGTGVTTNQTYQPILNDSQIAQLQMNPEKEPFDGDARKFRLAVEAMRLGIAYEFDPYFSLSIARVDPLPHQLEAVYEYFLRLPRNLLSIGEEQEPRFGRLGKEYSDIVFDKEMLKKDPSWEWVTPGHPLFEVMRTDVEREAAESLGRGAIFYDLHRDVAIRLDLFGASIRDGCNNVLNRRIFVVATELDGTISIHNPTIFHEIVPAESGVSLPDDSQLPDKSHLEGHLVTESLLPFLSEVQKERRRETQVVENHVETGLNALLMRENLALAELVTQKESGSSEAGLDGRIKQAENRIEELLQRLEKRRKELEQQRQCAVGDLRHLGRAWVLPHPERNNYQFAPMRRDDEVERIAVEVATRFLESDGYIVESVESQNLGYDLKARKPHPKDPKTAMSIRFVEVKGRARKGEIALTQNEYKTAERLKQDYWLYVVFQCATHAPSLNILRDPAKLRWEPITTVEHYRLKLEDPANPEIRETDQAAYGEDLDDEE